MYVGERERQVDYVTKIRHLKGRTGHHFYALDAVERPIVRHLTKNNV